MAKAEDTPKRGPGRPRKRPFPWDQPLGVNPRVLAMAVLRTPRGKPPADDEDEPSPPPEPPAES